MDGILQALLDVDEPIVIVVRHELHPSQQRLLVALGAGWVIDPVGGKRCARRCGRPECGAVSAPAVNRDVRVEAGEGGTVVIMSAFCETCDAEAMPDREGRCSYCHNVIVDEDSLPVKEMLAQIEERRTSGPSGLELLERMDRGERVGDGLGAAADVKGPEAAAPSPPPAGDEEDELEETPGAGRALANRAAADAGPPPATGVSSSSPSGSPSGPAVAAAPKPEESAAPSVDGDGGARTKRRRGELQRAVLAALVEGHATAMAISEQIGTPAAQVSSSLRVLVDKDLAEKIKQGVYIATAAGVEAAGTAVSLDAAQKSERERASAGAARNEGPPSRPDDEPGRRRAWERDDILAAIKRWNAEYGHPPTSTEWTRRVDGYPTTTTVASRFGSWANAIEAAGFPRPTRGGVPLRPLSPPAKRVRVRGTGLSYESADAAYLAADEIEADGERVADQARFDGNEAKAEQAIDQSRELAEKIRNAAHAFEARENGKTGATYAESHTDRMRERPQLLVSPEQMAPFQRSIVVGLIAGMRAAADALEQELEDELLPVIPENGGEPE